MKNFILTLLTFAITLLACHQSYDKPNIVLINIDDLGWLDVGFQGSQFYHTPNIDELSKQGLTFSNGYAAAANCAPSRASLMSGLWTPRHGIYTVASSERGLSQDRKLIPVKNTNTLDLKFEILPEILKSKGYNTYHAGKWHLNNDPTNSGFDVNIGGSHNGHPTSYYPPYGNVDLKAENGEYLSNLIMQKTLTLIEESKEPFFLNYSPYAVHTPIQGLVHLKSSYENKRAWQGQGNIDYATMIENMDRNIGLLIQTLKESGKFDNTLLIFTSDNGGLYGITKQLPLRAGKGSYYEGGIRVPFFFVWKGRIAANSRTDYPISHLDILPSLLAILGDHEIDQELDGQNLSPLLLQSQSMKAKPLFWHFPIYLQAYNKNDNQNRDPLFRTRPGSVVRYGDWKLHHYFEDDAFELFNIAVDESERENLSEKNPKKLKEMTTLLHDWRIKVKAAIPDQVNPAYVPAKKK